MQTELGSKNGELSGLINKYKKEAETSQQECLEVKKALETQVIYADAWTARVRVYIIIKLYNKCWPLL